MNQRTITVDGMQGLGDSIYQTPIISHLCTKYLKVHLVTTWPQIYPKHRRLAFFRKETLLRTQSKNLQRSGDIFETGRPALTHESIKLSYIQAQQNGLPFYMGLMQSAGVSFNYYLDLLKEPAERKRIAIVKPATIRKEWPAASRNPLQKYIQLSIDVLNSLGIETIVLADIKEGEEEYAEFRPQRASHYYEKGELPVEQIMQMVQESCIVVSGVGFMAPMCIATGTPAVIIHGGAGGWNRPELIDAPGRGKLTHILPTNYCMCKKPEHACDKIIENYRLEGAIITTLCKPKASQRIGLGTMESVSCL